MQDSQTPPAAAKPSRRGFFLGAATAGVAVAAVAVLPRVAGDTAVAAAPPMKPAPDKGGGYRLSDHVKHYYRTTSA